MTRRFRVTAWAYTATVIMVTVVVMLVFAVQNQRIGARRERGNIVHSLLRDEFLEHRDSIIAATAEKTSYLFLWQRDSILRARRMECGPLVAC